MFVGMSSKRGDNGIHTDHALTASDGIDTAVHVVKRFSKRVRHLVKRDQPDCVLVSDPLQGHAGYICA